MTLQEVLVQVGGLAVPIVSALRVATGLLMAVQESSVNYQVETTVFIAYRIPRNVLERSFPKGINMEIAL